MLLLLLAALALAAPVDATRRARCPNVRGGSTSDAPIPFPRPRSGSVFAGPLAPAGTPRRRASVRAARTAATGSRSARSSAPAGRSSSRARPHRGTLVLHYARDGDGEPVVRIEPCAPATPAFSYDGVVGPVTAFSGGFGAGRAGTGSTSPSAGARTASGSAWAGPAARRA